MKLKFIQLHDYCSDPHCGGGDKVIYWKLTPDSLNKTRRFDTKDECLKFANECGLEAEFVEVDANA